LKFGPHEIDVFNFISFPYSITDFQEPETLSYIPHGAKWIDVKNVISAPRNAKKGNHLKHKTKRVTDFLLTVRVSGVKD